jgi:uncharacterized protein YkwD
VIAVVLSAPAAQTAGTAFLAPPGTCGEAEGTPGAATGAQRRALVCLVNWARHRAGLGPVARSLPLSRAASRKGRDVVRCDDFSHTPCGAAASAAVRAVGYRFSRWGENLFVGTGELGSPRTAVESWLLSPPHRRTMFAQGFADAGVAVIQPRSFKGVNGASLWVLELARPA